MNIQKPGTGAPSSAPAVRIIQQAEMVDATGIKAIVTINGQLFYSPTPETPTEATTINSIINQIGGKV